MKISNKDGVLEETIYGVLEYCSMIQIDDFKS